MRQNKFNHIVWISLVLLFASQILAATGRYRLTWRDDPATTMSVIWDQKDGGTAKLFVSETYEDKVAYTPYDVSSSNTEGGMNNKIVRLSNLKPNTTYHFYFKDDNSETGRYNFKTAPNQILGTEFTFIHGGDSRSNWDARQKTNSVVPKLRPLFIVFGGDYTDEATDTEWRQWFDDWQNTIAEDNRMFPIVPVRGNHESNTEVLRLFDSPNSSNFYGLSVAGGLLEVVVLNSEDGPNTNNQDDFLKGYLASKQNSLWKFVNWHSPIAPVGPKSYRTNYWEAWAQVLYDNEVNLAGESHSHIVKRTYPLRPKSDGDGKYVRDDAKGTVYIGEGNWAAGPRSVTNRYEWLQGAGEFHNLNWIHVTAEAMKVYTVNTDDQSLSVGERSENEPFKTDGISLWKPAGTDPGFDLVQYSTPIRGCNDPNYTEYDPARVIHVADQSLCKIPVSVVDRNLHKGKIPIELEVLRGGVSGINFYLGLEPFTPAIIKIFDEQGKTAWQSSLSPEKTGMQIGLPEVIGQGIYFIQLTQNQKSVSKRFVVIK